MVKQIFEMRNNFINKKNEIHPQSKCKSESTDLKHKNTGSSGGNNLQLRNIQKIKFQKLKVQRFNEPFQNDNLYYKSKEDIFSNIHNTHRSKIDLLIEHQVYMLDIVVSKDTSIQLFINKSKIKKNNLVRATIIKKGNTEALQISEELRKNLFEFIKKYRLCQVQVKKQISLFFKYILNQNKNFLIGGGGCCSSRTEIKQLNLNSPQKNDEIEIENNSKNNELEIKYQSFTNQEMKSNETLIKNYSKNKEFEINYQFFTCYETIFESIVMDNQLKIQSNLLEKCIVKQLIQYEEQIHTYKLEIQDIFETYIMLETTRVSYKSDKKQEDFDKILQEVKSIRVYEEDFPIMELVFYAEMLTNLNKINYKFDENQQKEIKEFMNKILNFSKNKGTYSDIVSNVSAVRKYIKLFDKKKELFALKYSIETWLKKIDEFGDNFIKISEDVSSEILFYVKIFFEIYKQQNKQDEIILTLIRINYLLEKFQKEKSKSLDIEMYQQFSNNLMKAKIDEFLSQLMQKSDLFISKLFLIFSIENDTYRYITLSILININSIFTLTIQNTQNQEYLLDFLSNKYIIEKELAISVLFDKSPEFVQFFEKNIKNEKFQKRIINFNQQRKLKLLPYIENINDHERSINSFDDIIKLLSDNAIEKWERDIKKRQRQNLAQKDDVLLEVKDLYINQMITYQKGNQIFQKSQQNNIEEYTILEQNALQDIIQLFLNPNYSYRLKYLNNNNVDNRFFPQFNLFLNNNNSGQNEIENESEQIFKEQSKQCKILGILAEGGTGKSMLLKKIETFLIEKLSKLNTETGVCNYLPLLIKCNSLDSKNPSLDDYLKKYGGISEDQIQNLKENDRNKLILLDGYDEYTGDYFVIYKKLSLNQWKNTKVIVATRKEKLSEEDACIYFSKQNESGEIDEMSYSLVKLEEFTTKDIHEYSKRYFEQEKKADQINQLEDCLKNIELEKLLHLPINLYLFTRMLVHLSEKEVSNLKGKVSDQIGIQDIFFNNSFEREAQSFIDVHIHSNELKQDQRFRESLKNSYFEYFQTLAMRMFQNRDEKSNYLQIEKDIIKFKVSQPVIDYLLNIELVNTLIDKIKNYINSKIVTRSKDEVDITQENKQEQNIKYLIEFKHKSLFEYFVARAMKQDFDVHGDNIYSLTIEQLKEFKINQKTIMNEGENQSEQQILIKLYKMIRNEIESDEFYSSYHLEQIEKNNRYIQYIKKSTIKRNTETSQIDIGASNMLSVLFFSKYLYPRLVLRYCSFSKLYVSREKSDSIIFEYCNLKNSFLKNLQINYDTCGTQFATFDVYQKVFDTSDIYSFNHVIWDKNNILYSITESGFINAFKMENQIKNKVVLQIQKSKQFSQTPLSQILTIDSDALLVCSQYSLFLVNSVSFELLQYYKFKNDIRSIAMVKENILVTFINGDIFHGSFTIGFRKMNIIGSGCVFNESKQILLVYSGGDFSLYNTEEAFKLINKIQGHNDLINSVAFSPDGKYLATGSSDKTCKIWNVEKGFELINMIQDHSKKIFSVAFSSDGKYLATGSEDQTCKAWNAEKGFELINTMKDHTSCVQSVAFSADGEYLATGSWDKTCKIWDVKYRFYQSYSIQGHTNWILSVAFSADGKYLVTGSLNNTYKIWNQEQGFGLIKTIKAFSGDFMSCKASVAFSTDGKYLATGSCYCEIWNIEKGFENIKIIKGHDNSILSVAFSADGKYLATGSEDKTCKIWNVKKGFELINTIQGHTSGIQSVAFSVQGKYLATGSGDQSCKIWNVEKDFDLINTIEGHTKYINSVYFSSDGKYLATGSSDNTCKIWNVEKGFELINSIQDHTSEINSVVFSADGKYLATGSYDNTCKIWNVQKGFELINTIQGQSYVFSVAFSADGKYISTGSEDNSCKIWNAKKGFDHIDTIQGHTSYINSVAFSADGKYFATGSEDETFKIWNVEKGFDLMNTIQGHTSYINSISFSSDGKYLATGSSDKTCKIWNAEKGFDLINTISGHTSYINSVSFSSDSKYLATGSSDNTCKIWNVKKGFELINTIQGNDYVVSSLAFSGDGKYLAIGSNDTTCKIYNVEKSFELINTIQGHTSIILSVAFSADGKYFASGSWDKTCKIWNAESGFNQSYSIQGHTSQINSVAFSTDGKYFATGSQDNTCKIWNVEKGFKLINTIQCEINSIAFSANGKFLAIGQSNKVCRIWNTDKAFQLINAIQAQTDSTSSVFYSVDGKYICIEQYDKSYIIYDQQNFKIIEKQIQYEKLLGKYQLELNQNYSIETMRLFENMFTL